MPDSWYDEDFERESLNTELELFTRKLGRACLMAIVTAILFACVVAVAARADSPFETKVAVTPTSAITAQSARIEELSDRVAIFVEGEDPERKLGLRIAVQSTAKFVAVRAVIVGQGRPIAVSKLKSGDWLLFGKPAIYAITVIESDPEKGLNFTDVEATIGKPDKPTDPDIPPPIDTSELFKVAKAATQLVNDPTTAKALSAAYKSAANELMQQTIDEAKQIVGAKRRAVLLARTGESLRKDWNAWLVSIEPEVAKHLGTLEAYKSALLTLAKALE